MKTIPGILAIVAALVLVTTPAHAQTTTFTYQGFLTESGGPAACGLGLSSADGGGVGVCVPGRGADDAL